ncbi:AraC family transcriptional regulator [Anaerosporobacter sp.]|uniref:AraC family transcriptional regulator n=1 Tax=Anaerosporobacter sp. TaxID=1872529 RepID=UPI00286ECCFB|nr:AraC family transcriptional regulator [Anaerosporobacter sp.]
MQKDLIINNNNLKDANPIVCGEHICDKGHGFGPAVRDFFLLHYVISGSGTFACKNGMYHLSKGDIFIIRPDEETYYVADLENPWHYCWVGFESGIVVPSLVKKDVLRMPECEQIFMDMLHADKLKKSKELYLSGKIFELLAIINENTDVEVKDITLDYVSEAKRYIAQHYMEDISIEKIAKYLNLDRSYFSTIFKKMEGKSPQQYIIDFRLQNGAELILDENLSTTEVAMRCGYKDIFTFSKMFKKKYGISPSKFREKNEE